MGWTSVNECRDVDLRLKKESIVAFLCIAGGDQDMGALGVNVNEKVSHALMNFRATNDHEKVSHSAHE